MAEITTGGTGDTKPADDAKAAADKVAADKLIADKAVSDKAAADKVAADAAAAKGKTGGDAGGKAATDGATTSKAPDKYTLTIPVGSGLETADVQYVEEAARAAGLSNEDAQRVLQDTAERVAARAASWANTTKADPEVGGDKLVEAQTRANAVINRIRPAGHPRREAFLRFLHGTGAGNHVEVMAFLNDLAKGMGEDRPGADTGGGSGTPSTDDERARKLYDGGKK